jgi:hypothetical protein
MADGRPHDILLVTLKQVLIITRKVVNHSLRYDLHLSP